MHKSVHRHLSTRGKCCVENGLYISIGLIGYQMICVSMIAYAREKLPWGSCNYFGGYGAKGCIIICKRHITTP